MQALCFNRPWQRLTAPRRTQESSEEESVDDSDADEDGSDFDDEDEEEEGKDWDVRCPATTVALPRTHRMHAAGA